MKRAVATILAFLYLGMSTGLAINIHYCMGKVEGVSLNQYTNEVCGNCKAKMPCCGHLYKLVKVNDAHEKANAEFIFNTPQIALTQAPDSIDAYGLTINPFLAAKANAPPLLNNTKSYIKNCVFRI
jgi:hypothetical protein